MIKRGSLKRVCLSTVFTLILLSFVVYAYVQIYNPGHGGDKVYISVGGANTDIQSAIDDNLLIGTGITGGSYSGSIVFGHRADNILVKINGTEKTLQQAINFGGLCCASCNGVFSGYSNSTSFGHYATTVMIKNKLGTEKSLQQAIEDKEFCKLIVNVSKNARGTSEVVSNPSGIFCGNNCTGYFNHGQTITLSAGPSSQFSHWTGSCSGSSNFCTLLIDSNEQVGAIFNSYCGDGIINSPEQCEGVDFSGLTCASYGYNAGVLSCSGSCAITTSGCYNVGGGDDGSCPFIYSYDGEKYVLQFDSYSLSSLPTWEESAYHSLEEVKSVNGEIKVKISEELDETSYTNYVRLFAVSHADGTKVIPDQKGNVHTISNLVSPVSCSDDSGNDCLSAISKNDGDIWVQKWEDTNSNDDLYDEMTLTFPASSSSKVKIVYYGRKSTFLADSWENILGLVGGNNMPAFINLLKTSPLVDYLVTSLREDKGKLHFYTSDGADWNEQAAVYIGGQRSYWNVVELNVVPNEPIKVKIKEFVGTFTLDSVGIDYSEDNILNMKELPLNSAYKDGIDVSEKIRSNDKQYVETEKGDEVYLTFVDESKDDVSYVFEVGGYYVPIIKNRTFPDIKTLLEILTDDRKLVDYVVPEYIEQGGFAFE